MLWFLNASGEILNLRIKIHLHCLAKKHSQRNVNCIDGVVAVKLLRRGEREGKIVLGEGDAMANDVRNR